MIAILLEFIARNQRIKNLLSPKKWIYVRHGSEFVLTWYVFKCETWQLKQNIFMVLVCNEMSSHVKEQ